MSPPTSSSPSADLFAGARPRPVVRARPGLAVPARTTGPRPGRPSSPRGAAVRSGPAPRGRGRWPGLPNWPPTYQSCWNTGARPGSRARLFRMADAPRGVRSGRTAPDGRAARRPDEQHRSTPTDADDTDRTPTRPTWTDRRWRTPTNADRRRRTLTNRADQKIGPRTGPRAGTRGRAEESDRGERITGQTGPGSGPVRCGSRTGAQAAEGGARRGPAADAYRDGRGAVDAVSHVFPGAFAGVPRCPAPPGPRGGPARRGRGCRAH